MRTGSIGGISVRLSHTLDQAIERQLGETELILTHFHVLTDDNLAAQHREILDHLWSLGITLTDSDSSSIYTLMYKLLELQNEMTEPVGSITLSFVITTPKKVPHGR